MSVVMSWGFASRGIKAGRASEGLGSVVEDMVGVRVCVKLSVASCLLDDEAWMLLSVKLKLGILGPRQTRGIVVCHDVAYRLPAASGSGLKRGIIKIKHASLFITALLRCFILRALTPVVS